MFKKLVPLNREAHGKLKIKPIDTFDFAKDFHIASLMVHEFARAASVYPIVFLEDAEKDAFRPVVLLGLEAGENLYLAEDGSWNASYVPAIIRRYPFALARLNDNEEQFTVCLDEDSKFLDTKQGEALFDNDGEPTQVVENVKRYLGEMQQMESFSRDFSIFLAEHNLFNPLSMRVRYGDALRNVTGCYVVNEERLYNLSDKLFLEIRDKRYLGPIFSHLTSLSQIERLARFKDDQTEVTEPPAVQAEASENGNEV